VKTVKVERDFMEHFQQEQALHLPVVPVKVKSCLAFKNVSKSVKNSRQTLCSDGDN
jgi:hypothetical protein